MPLNSSNGATPPSRRSERNANPAPETFGANSTATNPTWGRAPQHAQAKPPPFAAVVCFDVSRFGRAGTDEAGYWRHTLAQAGVDVLYAAEGLTGAYADDLLLATKAWLAHRYVQDLSKVSIRGQVSRVEKGR